MILGTKPAWRSAARASTSTPITDTFTYDVRPAEGEAANDLVKRINALLEGSIKCATVIQDGNGEKIVRVTGPVGEGIVVWQNLQSLNNGGSIKPSPNTTLIINQPLALAL